MAEPSFKRNPIGYVADKYRTYVPSPLLSAGLVGLLGYGQTRLAWNPIMDTVTALGRPLARAAGTSDEEWDRMMEETREDSATKRWQPILMGLLGTGAHMLLNARDNGSWGGQFKWKDDIKNRTLNPADPLEVPYVSTQPMTKTEQLMAKRAFAEYAGDINFNKRIDANSTIGLFTNDPFLQNNQYVRNMGTAIVQNAANRQGSDNPTLGNVFDSAMNKINSKLTFSGMQNVGLKTVMANQMSAMFTGAVGAMTGLDKKTQNNLVSAGTWAGAISAILS